MNWEMFKSLLLTALVALSLALTWNLWNFHSEFAPFKDSDYVSSSVSADGKTSLGDVVYPLQAIFHRREKDSGLNATKPIKKMFTDVTAAKYSRARQLDSHKVGKEQAEKLQTESVALIFPRAITTSLFQEMLSKTAGDASEDRTDLSALDQDVLFNRMVFYKTPSRTANMRVYLKNDSKAVALADVNGLAYEDLNHFKSQTIGTFVSKDLADGPVYVPKNDMDVNKVFYYSYQWLDVSRFKSALFKNPQDVYHEGDYFTNGANSLKENNHIMKYVNPATGTNTSQGPVNATSIVKDSFDYINGHSGWTENYALFDYNQSEITDEPSESGDVTFRLMVGDQQSYPVFSRVYGNYPYRDAGTMLLNWRGGSVHDYARTLLDVPASADRVVERHLSSGATILQKLKKASSVKNDQIRDLRIGYAMAYPPKPNVLSFTPKWYVLYGEEGNAHWKQVDDLVKSNQKKENSQEEVTR